MHAYLRLSFTNNDLKWAGLCNPTETRPLKEHAHVRHTHTHTHTHEARAGIDEHVHHSQCQFQCGGKMQDVLQRVHSTQAMHGIRNKHVTVLPCMCLHDVCTDLAPLGSNRCERNMQDTWHSSQDSRTPCKHILHQNSCTQCGA
jgi:hypothetical protein